MLLQEGRKANTVAGTGSGGSGRGTPAWVETLPCCLGEAEAAQGWHQMHDKHSQHLDFGCQWLQHMRFTGTENLQTGSVTGNVVVVRICEFKVMQSYVELGQT